MNSVQEIISPFLFPEFLNAFTGTGLIGARAGEARGLTDRLIDDNGGEAVTVGIEKIVFFEVLDGRATVNSEYERIAAQVHIVAAALEIENCLEMPPQGVKTGFSQFSDQRGIDIKGNLSQIIGQGVGAVVFVEILDRIAQRAVKILMQILIIRGLSFENFNF
jgi:hypothetical protein